MTESREIAGGLVVEGEEALERVSGAEGPAPCYVRHPDAGGLCYEPAVMTVYGLPFCKIHGSEAKAGALEEAYHDAVEWLERMDNPHVSEANSIGLQALREVVAALRKEDGQAVGDGRDAPLIKAYPLIRQRVDQDTLDYDYGDGVPGESPVDWHYTDRMLLHKLMRITHEQRGPAWLIETLEEHRERVSAQLAFALTHCEEWQAKQVSANTAPDGG